MGRYTRVAKEFPGVPAVIRKGVNLPYTVFHIYKTTLFWKTCINEMPSTGEEKSDSDKFLSHKRRIIILFRRIYPGTKRRKLLIWIYNWI